MTERVHVKQRKQICRDCGVALTSDDIAIYRKMVFREAKEYLCMTCLADDLGVPRKRLEDIAAYYHRTGFCSLFVQYT